MADASHYASGRILVDTRKALFMLRFAKLPVIGSIIGKKLLGKIREFEPQVIDIDGASKLILRAEKCAAGERVCASIHKNSE